MPNRKPENLIGTESREQMLERLLHTIAEADVRIAGVNISNSYGLYRLIHRMAVRMSPGTEAFYLAFWDEEHQIVVFPYCWDRNICEQPFAQPLQEGPTKLVVESGEPYVINHDSELWDFETVRFGTGERSKSAVYLPIRRIISEGEHKVLGVLSCQSYYEAQYSPEVVMALQWLADRVGIALNLEKEQRAAERRQEAAIREVRQDLEEQIARVERVAQTALQSLQEITTEVERLQQTDSPLPALVQEQIRALALSCYRARAELIHPQYQPGSFENGQTPALQSMPQLTDREQEVLLLLCAGESNKLIASRLNLSLDTVKFHCKKIYRKLGVSSRLQAVRIYNSSAF